LGVKISEEYLDAFFRGSRQRNRPYLVGFLIEGGGFIEKKVKMKLSKKILQKGFFNMKIGKGGTIH